ncbi:MAG: DNA repair protein RecN [Elusimicrobiota bacterium]
MIEFLEIKNFAIIKNLNLKFAKGLNVFTGETGAGKSIIVESINFLFGARSYIENSKPVEVSAIFKDVNIGEVNVKKIEIKRILLPDGRSKYYIDNVQTSLSKIKEISDYIIDFHSQMENNLLFSPTNQLQILDDYLKNNEMRKKFESLYLKMKEIDSKLSNISLSNIEKEKLIELYSFQLDEIIKADIKDNEDIEVSEKIAKYKNIEKLKRNIEKIKEYLNGDNGVISAVDKSESLMDELIRFDESFFPLKNLVNDISIKLKDLYNTLSQHNIADDVNIDDLVARDELIKKMKKKYGQTIEDIRRKKIELENKIKELSEIEQDKGELIKEKEKLLKEMELISSSLSLRRKNGKVKFVEEVKKRLYKLGFDKVGFDVYITDDDQFNQHGKDKVEFLFTANLDMPLKPLRYVASGGESSRILLSIKSLVSKTDSSKILIFDEIDSGVGGNTAFAIGRMLNEISEYNQILCITHMPQVAVYAHKHFLVEKRFENKITEVVLKDIKSDERIEEIARMFGSSYSPLTAKKHASELLKNVSKKIK